MKDIVHTYIQRIYEKKDKMFFVNQCKNVPSYYEELVKILDMNCFDVKSYNMEDDPAIEVWMLYEGFIDGELEVDYKSILKISKVANLFVFQHEFSVKNKDTRRCVPELEGFGTEGYISQQADTEKIVSEFLKKQGLYKLSLPELEEVIGGINLPDNSIFGSQMTVENALFRDVYGFCE